MKNIALIGSTGSIGGQTVDVVNAHPDMFRIVGMAAGHNDRWFIEQTEKVKPDYFAAAEVDRQAALDIAALPEADLVVVACPGFAGLKYTLAALNAGKTVALANKESLVCGGELVNAAAKEHGGKILPVDSEHSAIWQCLGFDRSTPFKRLIITASGGPFRNYSKKRLAEVTPEMALKHPVWEMGAKISVDSATMLNKGFEVIEAHHLFGADYAAITAVLHPQGTIHSMVEFDDGSIMAQLSKPDMRQPILKALMYPERVPCADEDRLGFEKTMFLDFSPINKGDFPCFDLAVKCGKKGGCWPVVLNAASEVAVELFLKEKIIFPDIYSLIRDTVDLFEVRKADSYEEIATADELARVTARIQSMKYLR